MNGGFGEMLTVELGEALADLVKQSFNRSITVLISSLCSTWVCVLLPQKPSISVLYFSFSSKAGTNRIALYL